METVSTISKNPTANVRHLNCTPQKASTSVTCETESALNTIAEKYDNYNNFPQSHPSYGTEWVKFWRKRNRELVAQEINAADYDYVPEWILFWSYRLLVLKTEEIEKEKKKLKLCTHKNCDSKVQQLPSVPQKFSDECSQAKKRKQNAVTLLSYLRLLLVFEKELGLLAKPVLQLLLEAVKRENGSSKTDSLLDCKANALLVRTTQEKLKGVLSANFISPQKQIIIKDLIEQASVLLCGQKTSLEG